LKRGGVLNIVRHEIEVNCPADAIPERFEFSLEGLDIGRSIHISAITLPEGVKPTIQNRDFTVATIAGHRVEEEVRPEGEAVPTEGAAPAEGEEGAAAEAKPAAGKEAAAAGAKAPAGKEAAAAKPAADRGKK
jgi:large subunit ribosomal protein L25